MADFFTSFMFKLVMYKMGGSNEAAFSDDEHHRECFHGGGTWRERSLLQKKRTRISMQILQILTPTPLQWYKYNYKYVYKYKW